MVRKVTPADLITFWRDAGPKRWFTKDPAFDELFRTKFLALHDQAVDGRLAAWVDDHDGALGLLLLLDQFPRSSFRGTPRMFATDAEALAVAKAAIEAGHDLRTPVDLRLFFYLPFEHAESLVEQDRCVLLHEAMGVPDYTKYALVHRDVIARFGRFPHRNEVLGRTSTADELAFLAAGGFAG